MLKDYKMKRRGSTEEGRREGERKKNTTWMEPGEEKKNTSTGNIEDFLSQNRRLKEK